MSPRLSMAGHLPPIVVTGATLGILAAVYAFFVERALPQLDRYAVALDTPGLPPGGLVILHVSDLHLRGGGWVQRRKLAALCRLVRSEQYDVVAATGDLIHDMSGLPRALELLDALRSRGAPSTGVRAFWVPGNHDYCQSSVWGVLEAQRGATDRERVWLQRVWLTVRSLWRFLRKVLRNELVHQPVAYNDMAALQAALVAHGVEPLVNRAVPLATEGGIVWFAGVDDYMEGRPDLAAALEPVPADALLVLLLHNPDAWLDHRVDRAELVLAGHTHGGQIRLPLLGAVHTQGTHLLRRQAAGWFRRGSTRMFVSRGAGESLPLRFGARPQLALIQLTAGKRPGGPPF